MKEFTEQQVDDIIKLKFGRLVTEIQRRSYVRDSILGKLFKVSASTPQNPKKMENSSHNLVYSIHPTIILLLN